MLHRHDGHNPMSKSIFEYLNHARRFERLACLLSDEAVKRLLQSQAETCRRLAVKHGREGPPQGSGNTPRRDADESGPFSRC